MDSRNAHLITLWCAVLSKSDRGMTRLLPKDLPLQRFRVLAQLTLPETAEATAVKLARSTVLKPNDVEAALEVLVAQQLVAAKSAKIIEDGESAGSSLYSLTPRGRAFADELIARVADYFERCRADLSVRERRVLAEMLVNALTVPGSFYAKVKLPPAMEAVTIPMYRITAFTMMSQAIATTIKTNTGLSFTDFRFLLELYPKRRGADKRLRAKDMVGFLRTGRAYVTTASLRLEEQGLIERIPDRDDARGIQFKITPLGMATVERTAPDIFAVFASLFGSHIVDRPFIVALKRLLEGQDRVYNEIDS